jgi:hypothetical protein
VTTIPAAAYDEHVLDPVKHVGLAADIDFYAERAGIKPHWIWTSALPFLTKQEVGYLRACKTIYENSGCVGAFYLGADDVTERMSRMVGALVRGFVDARLLSAQRLIDYVDSGQLPEATVLFCPNFYSSPEFGNFSERRIAALSTVLYERASSGQQTVIHIDHRKKAMGHFGQRFLSLVDQHMLQFEGDNVSSV